MAPYFTYVIKNTYKGEFMVVRRHGLPRSSGAAAHGKGRAQRDNVHQSPPPNSAQVFSFVR